MKEKSSTNNVTLCQPTDINIDEIWKEIHHQATVLADKEPQLRKLLTEVVLSHQCLFSSLSARLASKLAREDMTKDELYPLLFDVLKNSRNITLSAITDIQAIFERDPACHSMLEPLLFYKGFMAITTYRISHHLWVMDRKSLALYFQSISSEIFGVDIHPAARVGCGLMLDHATSVVMGETAIVEDNVSILHEVTLGGTGKQKGSRHPIVRSGVMIGAGAKILGRVEIGTGAKIGAGSVVLEDVPPHTTVAGVPAIVVGHTSEANPALEMNQSINCGQI